MLARCLLSRSQSREVKLFYSYARADKAYRDAVDDVLARFNWDVSVRAWYDGEIRPGMEWEEQIRTNLDSADIVLLFITQGFVNSEFCMKSELPRALERHDCRETRVIPILLEPTDPPWTVLPFSHLQVLPPGGLPLSEWHDRNQCLRETTRAIVNAIAEPFLEAADRTRWKVYLSAGFAQFTLNDEAEVVATLRDVSGDATMRSRGATTDGSVIIDMDSTRDGFARVRQWFSSPIESQKQLSSFEVLRLIEWYGASVHAAAAIGMPAPPSPPDPRSLQFPSEPGVAPFIKGLTVNTDAPMKSIDFIFDPGNLGCSDESIAAIGKELTEDFLTLLATPESEWWVNLSPNDSMKLLGRTLQGTRVGRTLLEHDLRLKRLASSLIHPDHEVGAAYWQRVFAQSRQLTGHLDHPFHTHPRLWMVPRRADIIIWESEYEPPKNNEGSSADILKVPLPKGHKRAFVIDAAIEVLCEQDHLGSQPPQTETGTVVDRICHEAFVEIVLPVVEKEVNSGRAFAGSRQLYSTLILASWMKNSFKNHPDCRNYFDSGDPHQFKPTIQNVAVLGATGNTSVTADAHMSDFDEGVRLREVGELVRSRAMLERVLEDRLRTLGEDQFLVQVTMSQLGRTLLAMGEFQRAEILHRRVLEIRKRVLGERHQFTINSMRILADTLTAMGQATEASRLTADAAAVEIVLKPEWQDPDNQDFYARYLDIYRNGVFFVQRHEYEASTGCRATRAYFSGAIDLRTTSDVIRESSRWPAV